MEVFLEQEGMQLLVEWRIFVRTCFEQMAEDQSRQNIDCCCSEQTSQNQLEMSFVVKLDELCRLKNGSI